MKNIWILLIVGIFAVALTSTNVHAIRSTKHESFTDPDYLNYQPRKIVLVVENTDNETRAAILKKIQKKFEKFGVTVVGYRNLLPPTRNWTPEDRAAIYEREGIDSVLVVTAGASASSVMHIATQSFGTTKVSGSTFGNTFNATGQSNTTSYNIYSVKSKADFSAILLDVSNSRIVWYVDVRTKAGGYLFVGDKRDGKAVAKEIIKALEDDGHIIEIDK